MALWSLSRKGQSRQTTHHSCGAFLNFFVFWSLYHQIYLYIHVKSYIYETCSLDYSFFFFFFYTKQPPLNLVLHLKRFTVFGSKQRHHVNYPELLALDDYTSWKHDEERKKEKQGGESASRSSSSSKKNKKNKKKQNRKRREQEILKRREISVRTAKHLYELYGVIVHYGTSIARGHYACVVKNSNGLWYDMDDDEVTSVKLKTVSYFLLFFFDLIPSRDRFWSIFFFKLLFQIFFRFFLLNFFFYSDT